MSCVMIGERKGRALARFLAPGGAFDPEAHLRFLSRTKQRSFQDSLGEHPCQR
jgi:hypothetical protein